MDFIKETEKYLENYRRLEKSLENIAFRISKLNMGRTTNNLTQSFEVTGIHGSKNEMDPEIQLLEWTQLKAMQTETQEELNNIDYNLKFISLEKNCEHYGKLLRMWYIEKQDITVIADEIGYHRTKIYGIKRDALKKLSVQLFGKRALAAI
ncbi:MAG TPA: hypothetical protein VD757_02695 [Candidatus Nitrosocosmicus sp.]|nr:hypothetical protein [Candidatus Nitrosocosmicus sp.]